MSDSTSNNSWPDFFLKNRTITWLIVLVLCLVIGRWLLLGGKVVIKDWIEVTFPPIGDTVKIEKPKQTITPSPHPPTIPNAPKGDVISQKLTPFEGTVLDDESNPISNVKVICEDQTSFTNESGKFRMNLPINPPGRDMEVVLIKEGYSSPPYHQPNNSSYLLRKN